MWWKTARLQQGCTPEAASCHAGCRTSWRAALAKVAEGSRHLHRLLLREGGQSLAEFAITLPLLLLLLLGTVDLGMGFKTYIGLTNAAREGARWISIHPTDQTGAKSRVAEEALRIGLLVSEKGYSVRFTPDQSDYAVGEKVTVSVDYNYELLFGTITGLPDIEFTASTTMAVLYDE